MQFKKYNMENNLLLSDANKGDHLVIRGFSKEEIPSKFYEMGLLEGTSLEIKNKAPLGGPICICISENNSLLALRRKEASKILINKK